jgi:translocation and assembly module TamB
VTEPAVRSRSWWKLALMVAGAGLAASLVGMWYITTDSFQAYVRHRLVAEVERLTGGKAAVGSFHVVPFHMQIEVRDITVRGTEAPNEPPLAHADHLIAQVKVISLLRTEFGFHSLVLEHPVIRVAIGPDGTSNVPALSASHLQKSEQTAVDKLFALSIDRLSLENGELIWADKKIPLDFTVDGAALQLEYSFLRGRYEGHLAAENVETVFQDFRPFSWTTSANFSLGPTFVDIKSSRWNSGRSQLEASGRVSDFRNPYLDGIYTGHVDLAEAAAISHRPDLRGGIAEFKGAGHWSLNEFSSDGSLTLRDLSWRGEQVAMKKASATADYSLTDRQLKLSNLQGKLFGGSFSGDAQVENWLHSIPPPPPIKPAKGKNGREEVAVIGVPRPPLRKSEKAKQPGVQMGAVHLRLRDVSAAEVAAALSVPAHPLGRFRPVGLTSGTVDAAWTGSPKDADVRFAFDVTPPAHSATGELPLTAHTQGRYSGAGDVLDLNQFNLTTPASRIQANGTLSTVATLRFSVSTSNLEEWRPLVAALGGPTNVPFRVDGNAAFTGLAEGTVSAPTLTGTLLAQDFEFTLPATTRTPEQAVHWDSLAASIHFSSQELDLRGGSLRRGETSADFNVRALLHKGQFTEYSPYTAHVNLHHVDVASTAVLAGFDYPVSGTADIALQVSGTRANPRVEGHIRATGASAYNEPIENFDAELHIADGQTTLNNIQLTHEGAIVSGIAAYTPSSRAFRLDLAGANFDLARVPQIHTDRLAVEGRGDFTLKGSGTIDAPVIQAAVHVRDLSLDREAAGGFYLEGTTRQGDLRLTGRSELLHGTMTIDGHVQMHGDYPAQITARLDHVDADSLWRSYIGQQLTGHSAVGGQVTMQGPLRYPQQWTVSGDLNDLFVELEHAKLHNEGPVQFAYAGQVLTIAPLHLVGEGTDVTGHGTTSFKGKEELDLAADGQMDLKLLESLNSDITSTGLMTVHMRVGGTLHQPLPQGTIVVKEGNVVYAGLPSGLSGINGSLTFTQHQIHINTLTARTGGGMLDFKGDANAYDQQISFNLTAVGKEVRLRYPPGVSSTANAELHWVGNLSSSTISGNILVTKLAVTPGFDFGSYLQQSRQSVGIVRATSPLYSVKLDIAARTAPELQMKTAVARLSGDANLRLRGSLASPSVLGRADILEGEATFNGIKFRLERGDITFANPVAIEPQVNLQATTHVRNYDLDVTVTGTPDRLNVNYRSEPPLPKSDIIALLALGRTNEESEQLQEQSGQVPFTDVASAMIINQAISSTVSSRLQKLFGVSRIKIDPQGLTTETNPTARGPQVTIEQQFANNVSLTYSTNVSQSSQQIIQGEYYFTRNISTVGTRDQNGVVSFDVRIRRRKK